MNEMKFIWQNLGEIVFAEPHWLWLGFAVLLLIPLWKRLRPALAHPNTSMHTIRSFGWPFVLCLVLLSGSWLAFTAAMARPKLATEEMREFLDARDFVIGIDRSGSMFTADIENPALFKMIEAFEQEEKEEEKKLREKFPNLYPYPPEVEEKLQDHQKKRLEEQKAKGQVQRFKLARWAAVQFLRSRPEGDRAGMFTFDDDVYWAWPLGADVNVVLRKVSELSTQSGGGTNFDGPRSNNPRIGAFQGAIDHFESLGKARVRVMIFISDGDAGISPERHQQLVEQMTKEGKVIHIFALVCGSEEQLKHPNTQSMRKLVEAVNPKGWKDSQGQPVDAVIWAGNGDAMQKAFARISELEKSTIELEPVETFKDVTFYFIVAGCAALAVFLIACALFREEF